MFSAALCVISRGSGPTSPPLPSPPSHVRCPVRVPGTGTGIPTKAFFRAFSSPSPPPNKHPQRPRSSFGLARPITLRHHAPPITYITGVGYRTVLCVTRRVRACLLASSCVVCVCVCGALLLLSLPFPSLASLTVPSFIFPHIYTHTCAHPSLPPSVSVSCL